MKFIKLTFFSFLLIILLNSCAKTDIKLEAEPVISPITALSVNEAKSWYEQNSLLAIVERGDSKKKFKNPKPEWNKGIATEDDKWFVVESPVTFDAFSGINIRKKEEQENTDNIESDTRLLVLKNKISGSIQPVLMHLLPTVGKADSVNYKNRKTFSGKVLFTDIAGNFLNGWVYNSGKIKSQLKSSENNLASRTNADNSDCVIEIVDYYVRYCYEGGGENYRISSEQTRCTVWEYIGSNVITECPDDKGDGDGGVGGGGTSEFSNFSTEVNICKNSFHFVTYITSSGNPIYSGGWQIAAVNNIRFKFNSSSPNYPSLTIKFPTLYFGLPIKRSNGTIYSYEDAQSISTEAVKSTELVVYGAYKSGYTSEVYLTNLYLSTLQTKLSFYSGTVTKQPGSGMIIQPKDIVDAEYPGLFGCW